MEHNLILQPLFALIMLTAAVWVFMYVRRLAFILNNQIDPQRIATPEKLNAVIPAEINNSSNNLKNLFELPIIFYVLCLVLLATQRVDMIFLYSAWAYVGLRAIHSLIHCTFNVVNLRFAAYFLSSLVLWFIAGRLAISVL
jgi:hypothetical protein